MFHIRNKIGNCVINYDTVNFDNVTKFIQNNKIKDGGNEFSANAKLNQTVKENKLIQVL